MRSTVKFFLILLGLLPAGSPICSGASESELSDLKGVWTFKSAKKHYSRTMELDYFFGENDVISFFAEEGLNGSVGVTSRSQQRKCSIGDLYLIWVEQDERGLVLKFGSDRDPIVFIGSRNGNELKFEFVSHGETRIEYCFERTSNDPSARPENSRSN